MNNQSIDVLKKRDIDRILFSITIVSQTIFYDDGNGYIYKRNVDVLIGCNINGVRKYITSVFEDEFANASDWYNLFINLKEKHLSHVYFIISDNDKINQAFKLAFSGGKTFYCFFNDIYRLNHYISFSYSNDILEKSRKVCLSSSIDEFNLRKKDLCDAYSDYPFISDILSNSFDNYIKYFNYSLIIRKHLLSFYFLREFKKNLLKMAHFKPFFTSLDEYIDLLLPTIQTFEKRMYCTKKEWNGIITYLYNQNKELLLCEL